MLFLAHNNSLYVCGSNRGGRLGIEQMYTSNNINPLMKIPFFEGKTILNIVIAPTSVYVLLNINMVVVAGDNQSNQLTLDTDAPHIKNFTLSPHRDIKSISAYGDSFYAIKTDGSLYVCGNNQAGQLGVKNKLFSTPYTKVSIKKVRNIIPGQDCAFLIDASRNVWSTGNNEYGQLGLNNNNKSVQYFTKVPIVPNIKLVMYKESTFFVTTFILSRDNILFSTRTNLPIESYPDIAVKNIDKSATYIETVDKKTLKYDDYTKNFTEIMTNSNIVTKPLYVPINSDNMLYPTDKYINDTLVQAITTTINMEERLTIQIKEIKYLSEGTFGKGFKITLSNDAHVFAKVPTSAYNAYKFLKEEFTLLTKLTHPNIIDEKYLIDFASTDIGYTTNDGSFAFLPKLTYRQIPNMCIMITELYEDTINKLGRDHWLNPINTLNFISIMSHTLFYLNEQSYVHKDVKENNIMYIKKDGNIYYKLIDFGVTRKLA